MKHTRFTSILNSTLLLCATTAGLLLSTGKAVAQTGSPTLKATIPFAFQAGTRRMPAGAYEITLLSPHTMLLRGSAPHAVQFVMTNPAISSQTQDTGRLIFAHYGSRYFLHEIWKPGTNEGVHCPRAAAEKEILNARSTRPDPRSAENVQVALNSGR